MASLWEVFFYRRKEIFRYNKRKIKEAPWHCISRVST